MTTQMSETNVATDLLSYYSARMFVKTKRNKFFMPQQPAQARSHHQSHLSRMVGQTSPRPRSSMFPFEMMMLKKCEINLLAKLPS